jgi:hypothetical protein
MAAVLVIGGVLGWLPSHCARAQREAAAEIKAVGGRLLYEWQSESEL